MDSRITPDPELLLHWVLKVTEAMLPSCRLSVGDAYCTTAEKTIELRTCLHVMKSIDSSDDLIHLGGIYPIDEENCIYYSGTKDTYSQGVRLFILSKTVFSDWKEFFKVEMQAMEPGDMQETVESFEPDQAAHDFWTVQLNRFLADGCRIKTVPNAHVIDNKMKVERRTLIVIEKIDDGYWRPEGAVYATDFETVRFYLYDFEDYSLQIYNSFYGDKFTKNLDRLYAELTLEECDDIKEFMFTYMEAWNVNALRPDQAIDN